MNNVLIVLVSDVCMWHVCPWPSASQQGEEHNNRIAMLYSCLFGTLR